MINVHSAPYPSITIILVMSFIIHKACRTFVRIWCESEQNERMYTVLKHTVDK